MMMKNNGEETQEAIGFHEMREWTGKQLKMRRTMMMRTVTTAMSGEKKKTYGWKELIWEAWTDSQRHNHRLLSGKKRGHSEQEEVQDREKLFMAKEGGTLKKRDSQGARKNGWGRVSSGK
jgi:hypothetical protein